MKQMVERGKQKGLKLTCDSCHKNQDTYDLTPNALADFKTLTAAQ
jgi:hypothetical protein